MSMYRDIRARAWSFWLAFLQRAITESSDSRGFLNEGLVRGGLLEREAYSRGSIYRAVTDSVLGLSPQAFRSQRKV